MNSTASGSDKLLERFDLLPEASLLLALSGGADSSYLCLRLASDGEFDRRRCMAVHVDHGIRDSQESLLDRRHVQALCDSCGIDLEVVEVGEGTIVDEATRDHRSLEDLARELRYEVFEELRAARDLDFVLLGHHADDQDETVIMRVIEGSGPFGLKGIPERRGHYLRPLLGFRREQIIQELEHLPDASYREDSTNDDLRFKRNRVRKELVPLLGSLFPGYQTALESFREKQEDVAELVETLVGAFEWSPQGEGFSAPLQPFWALPAAIRLEAVVRLWSRATGTSRVPYRFVRALRKPRPDTQGVLLRGHGGNLQAAGDYILWQPDVVQSPEKQYCIHVKNDIERDLGFLVTRTGSCAHRPREIRYESANGPLVVRSRRPGDLLSGKDGSKSVKNMLNEWKVPEGDRWRVPVIQDRRGVFAVLGKSFGGRDRYRYIEGSTDSVLRIELDFAPRDGMR